MFGVSIRDGSYLCGKLSVASIGVLSISCKLQAKPSIHCVLGKDLFCCSRSCAGCSFLFGQSTHRQEVFSDVDEIALRWNDL